MKMEESHFYYGWDSNLQYSNGNFDQLLHQNLYDNKLASEVPFPSDYLLAQFSQLAYENDHYHLPKGWELLTTGYNDQYLNGYFGVAFWNPKLCQVVVAHRGTKLSNLGALIADLELGLLKRGRTGQAQSAATFTYKIASQIGHEKFKNGPPFQLSITGHSLGAWLGQITTFTLRYLKRDCEELIEDKDYLNGIYPHTVVFESPGCKQAMDIIAKGLNPYLYLKRKYANYDNLDITVYLSKLNPINVVNKHVGTIFMIGSKTHSINEILELFDKSTHEIDKEVVWHFKSGFRSAAKRFLEYWLPIDFHKSLVTRKYNKEICSLNVFTEDESDFIKDWAVYSGSHLPHLHQFKEDHALPFFSLDNDLGLFKSSDVMKVITCIKTLKPNKALMVDLLRKDIPNLHELFKQLLNVETQYFQEILLEFWNYSFKDKYELEQLLGLENFILHVRNAERNTEYELDSSIINSILRCHPVEHEYYFLKWKKFNSLIKLVPDVATIFTEKLIILDCFDAEENDYPIILEFLSKQKRIIIISLDKYSWKQEISTIHEVNGYGNKVSYQDLDEDSQNRFINHKYFKLHDKEMSLKEITNVTLPLTKEVTERINKVIPFNILINLALSPSNELVELDYLHSNFLKPFILSDLYEEVQIDQVLKAANGNITFLIEDPEECFVKIQESNRNIKVKKRVDFEKCCFEMIGKDNSIYLCNVQNGTLFLTKIFNNNFYIPRYITHRNIVSPEIFKINKTLDKFFCRGDKEKFHQLNREENECFEYDSLRNNLPENIPKAHILEIQKDNIIWIKSQGNIEMLYKYVGSQEINVNEEDMIGNRKIVIITGEPGSGKSSTISRLYLQFHQTHWVFVVPLKRASFEIISSVINYDNVAKFIAQSTNHSNKDVIQHLLAYCLKCKTNLQIFLMFDAFDDISNNEQRIIFTKMINFLKETSATILIATRNFRCRQLENEIYVFASVFKKFDRNREMVNFYLNFWHLRLLLFKQIDVKYLKEFTNSILENAEETLGEGIHKMIGLPLYMKKIAEVLTPEITKSSTILVDILNLFQKYASLCYNTYFHKKMLNDPILIKWLSENLHSKHCILALTKLNPDLENTIDYNDYEELNNIGLIQSQPDDILIYEFQHDSVRDYFLAHAIKLWLNCQLDLNYFEYDMQRFVISDVLIKPEFKEIRLFFNLMLRTCSISEERIDVCRNNFERFFNENRFELLYNEFQDSAYHICVKENLVFLIKFFLHKIVNDDIKKSMLSKRNIDNKTCIYFILTLDETEREDMMSIFANEFEKWSPANLKEVFLSTFFTHFANEQDIKQSMKYFQNDNKVLDQLQQVQEDFKYTREYLEACKFDNPNKLKVVLEKIKNDGITKEYLLQMTDERMNSGLHLTSNEEIVNILFENKIPMNLQDHHGMTALNRAIKNNKPEIAVQLINKNVANTVDLIGNSPLMHAIKCGNFFIVKLLLDSKTTGTKCDVDNENTFKVTPLMLAVKFRLPDSEKIVKHLLDKNPNINQVDCNGMNAFFHALKADNRSYMRLLKKRGIDIDVQDKNGITPLYYGIQKRDWDNVQFLLDNNANVNLGNAWKRYPIQELIKAKHNKYIKRILEEVKNEKGEIIRAATRIDVLNEDEINYINNLRK